MCSWGLVLVLGVCPSSILKQKNTPQYQKTHCFLSRRPKIALAWTRRIEKLCRGSGDWNRPVQREVPALSEAGAEGCGRSQRAGGTGRQGAGGSHCQATGGDTVVATLRRPGGCWGAGRRWGAVWGGPMGRALQHRGSALAGGQIAATWGQAGRRQPALPGEGNS